MSFINKLSAFFFLVLWVGLGCQLVAQVNEIKFKSTGIKQGLSHPNVFAVLQDSKGYMWFGTKDGLDLYDGYQVKSYKNNPMYPESIPSNHVQALLETKDGAIWVGTYDGGLGRLNRQTGKFKIFRNKADDATSLSANNVYAIHQDTKGTIWVGTFGGGLCRLDEKTGLFKTYTNAMGTLKSLGENAIFSICEDKKGILWLGTFGGGLLRFDPATEQLQAYLHREEDPTSLPSNDIFTIYADTDENLWLGTNGSGLCRFNPKTGQSVVYTNHPTEASSISSNYILSIRQDALGTLWLGTKGGGLCRFNPRKEQFNAYVNTASNLSSLPHNDINSLCLDKAGTLWIATDGGGVCRFETQSLAFTTYVSDSKPGGFSAGSVISLYEDRQRHIWIGTFGDGLYQYNRQTGKYTAYKNNPANAHSLSEDVVTAVCEDAKGVTWVGTSENGLCRLDSQTGTFTIFKHDPATPGSVSNNSIETLFRDRSGTLWVGTYGGGLCRFNAASSSFFCYQHDPQAPKSLIDNAVKVIYQDKKGTLWIGTKNAGLSRLDANGKTFTNYRNVPTNPLSLSSNAITAITEDKTGALWIGTFDKGLCRFDSKNFASFTTRHGLPDDVVCGLLSDEQGNLWVSSTKGLARFHPQSHQIRRFTTDEGLYSDEFVQWSYHKNQQGELFFGGTNNFISFHPDDLRDNPFIAPIYLTAFKLYDKKKDFGKALSEVEVIELEHNDNFFSFEFVMLNYLDPEKNQYAYKMEGFDKDWNHIGNRRFATYTNLDAREYTFRVKAADKNGVWNETGAAMRIIIHPAWYNTWWFRALSILLMLGSIYTYYRYRIRTIEEQKAVLEIQVAERTADLQEEKIKLEKAYEEISTQNENLESAYVEINQQKDELQKKSNHITSSINYAKRIQEAMLPLREEIGKAFCDSFVLFKPRDIVSGDFYWFSKKEACTLIAVVDCTGHGVPGAFMSMIGNSLLNQIVNESGITAPAEILRLLHLEIRKALKQEEGENHNRDGMDMAICAIHWDTKRLEYAGANRPLIAITEGQLLEIKATPASIGGMYTEELAERVFEQHTMPLAQSTCFYMYTDGYADQLSGKTKRKFMTKNLKELLLTIHTEDFTQQGQTLDETIEDWKADFSQLDDMLVIGFKI